MAKGTQPNNFYTKGASKMPRFVAGNDTGPQVGSGPGPMFGGSRGAGNPQGRGMFSAVGAKSGAESRPRQRKKSGYGEVPGKGAKRGGRVKHVPSRGAKKGGSVKSVPAKGFRKGGNDADDY